MDNAHSAHEAAMAVLKRAQPIQAYDARNNEKIQLRLELLGPVGSGTFGAVHRVSLSGIEYALKTTFQSRTMLNRELRLLRSLRSKNVVTLYAYFVSTPSSEGHYLHLLMELMPESLLNYADRLRSMGIPFGEERTAHYTRQLFEALSFLHSRNVCHRDVKPSNALVDSRTGTLKLCDLGSAKELNHGTKSTSYVCSRCYRAPELILGSEFYTVLTDVWSAACVAGELLLGEVLFDGTSSELVFRSIVVRLGLPTKEDVLSMKATRNGIELIEKTRLSLSYASSYTSNPTFQPQSFKRNNSYLQPPQSVGYQQPKSQRVPECCYSALDSASFFEKTGHNHPLTKPKNTDEIDTGYYSNKREDALLHKERKRHSHFQNSIEEILSNRSNDSDYDSRTQRTSLPTSKRAETHSNKEEACAHKNCFYVRCNASQAEIPLKDTYIKVNRPEAFLNKKTAGYVETEKRNEYGYSLNTRDALRKYDSLFDTQNEPIKTKQVKRENVEEKCPYSVLNTLCDNRLSRGFNVPNEQRREETLSRGFNAAKEQRREETLSRGFNVPNEQRREETLSRGFNVPNEQRREETLSRGFNVPNEQRREETLSRGFNVPNEQRREETLSRGFNVPNEQRREETLSRGFNVPNEQRRDTSFCNDDSFYKTYRQIPETLSFMHVKNLNLATELAKQLSCSYEAASFLVACFVYDPYKRTTAENALKHSFLQSKLRNPHIR